MFILLAGVLGVGVIALVLSSALGMLWNPWPSVIALTLGGWVVLLALRGLVAGSESWGGHLDEMAQLSLAAATALLASVALFAGYANGRRRAGVRGLIAGLVIGGIAIAGLTWAGFATPGWGIGQDDASLSRSAHRALDVPAQSSARFERLVVDLGCERSMEPVSCVASERYESLSMSRPAWLAAAGTFVLVLGGGIAFREGSAARHRSSTAALVGG